MDNEMMSRNTSQHAMKRSDGQGVIDNQKRREQQNAVRSSKLPKKTNECSIPHKYRFKGTTNSMEWGEREEIINRNNYEYTREQYEKMGIRVIGEYDDLFYSVVLPEGWEIKETDHLMWNDLMDNKGRKRISFFYKGSYWDRDAFSNFSCRYSFSISPFDSYKTNATYEERKFRPWSLFITDCGKNIKRLEEITVSTDTEYFALDDKLRKMARDFLNENYPDWEDMNAYWD